LTPQTTPLQDEEAAQRSRRTRGRRRAALHRNRAGRRPRQSVAASRTSWAAERLVDLGRTDADRARVDGIDRHGQDSFPTMEKKGY